MGTHLYFRRFQKNKILLAIVPLPLLILPLLSSLLCPKFALPRNISTYKECSLPGKYMSTAQH